MSRRNAALRVVGLQTRTYRSKSGEKITHTFHDGDLAQRWIEACENSEKRGLPLPSPLKFTPRATPVPAVVPASSNLTDVSWAWFDDTFRAERNGSPDRRTWASAALRLHIIPQLGDLDASAVTAQDIDAFVDYLAGLRIDDAPPLQSKTAKSELLPLPAVAKRTGQPNARLRRLAREGLLPSTVIEGRLHLPVEVLQSPLVLPAGERPSGMRKSSAAEVLAVLRLVFGFAVKHGLVDNNPAQAARARKPLDPNARTKPAKTLEKVVMLTDCVRVCSHLHPIHQMAFWLQRCAGLRIGEAYGLRLRDVVFEGDYAVLRIEGMGGKNRAVRDPDSGEIILTRRKPTAKTERGNRIVMVTGPLRQLLDRFIDIHHLEYQPEVPLLPGIAVFERPSIAAFGSALKAAVVAEALTPEHLGYPISPKTLRASFSGEAKAYALCGGATLSQIMGHAPPIDNGESEITRNYYSPQLPGLEKLREAADAMGAHVANHIGSLFVPTTKQVSHPAAHPLARRREIVEQQYHESGWRAGRPGLTLDEVSAITGLSRTAIRKRITELGIPTTRIPGPNNGPTRYVPTDSVEKIAATGRRTAHRIGNAWTLTGVCAQTNISSNGLLKRIHRGTLDATFDPITGIWLVPDDEVRRLRSEAGELKRLHTLGVSLTDASAESGLTFSALLYAVKKGDLRLRPNRDRSGHRYIDRRSFENFQRNRGAITNKRGPGPDWMPVSEAARQIGTTRKGVLSLVAVGLVARRDYSMTAYVNMPDLRRVYPDVFGSDPAQC